jgi:excisionase family DNA binding protein
MYTEKEAAKVLNVSYDYLKQMAVNGEILYVAWGTQRRYPHFYLEEWLRKKLLETSLKDLADPSKITIDNLVALYQVKKTRDNGE